ncbi:ATP-binding protein [Rubrobacter indicoceani]|uniref:ATP-binding protein n=1 Tax=Rubrobacter indicoceani TaxID=2051957 RepID=UPI000E5B2088|nr:ATP-binding protein [Rubrobacter indicoceani]
MKDHAPNGTSSGLLTRLLALAVFREVLNDAAVALTVHLVERLESGDVRNAIGDFAALRGEIAAGEEPPLLEDAWGSRVVSAVLDAESVFARKAESGTITEFVRDQGRRDLGTLRDLFDLDFGGLRKEILAVHPELEAAWTDERPRASVPEAESPRQLIARKLRNASEWGDLTASLEAYFVRNGTGLLGRYRAFRWEDGTLRPVSEPDAISSQELIGYGRERGMVALNTERFVRGAPAQHALLYGPPGTGKSSTVKAVFNHYAPEGLRLVEVSKERLFELPRLLEALRGRGPRFIVYVDDLSFEENEVEYKSLKALIEGSIESPPENVRVYATSNRRNLIRESFSEREGDDVHARDSTQEKLSLAARFGLRVTFLSPDQKTYLDIVRGIAEERGLDLCGPKLDALNKEALRRERWGSGRSGRAARQAVDDFEAGLEAR